LLRSQAKRNEILGLKGPKLVEDVTVFEPREFIEAGEKVTVLGYLESSVRDTKQKF
jgi:hypothetical protein